MSTAVHSVNTTRSTSRRRARLSIPLPSAEARAHTKGRTERATGDCSERERATTLNERQRGPVPDSHQRPRPPRTWKRHVVPTQQLRDADVRDVTECTRRTWEHETGDVWGVPNLADCCATAKVQQPEFRAMEDKRRQRAPTSDASCTRLHINSICCIVQRGST